MSLKEDLDEWVEEYLDYEVPAQFTDDLWEFLQDQIGPVQEKLLDQIQMLRDERTQLSRRLEAVLHELARLQQTENS